MPTAPISASFLGETINAAGNRTEDGGEGNEVIKTMINRRDGHHNHPSIATTATRGSKRWATSPVLKGDQVEETAAQKRRDRSAPAAVVTVRATSITARLHCSITSALPKWRRVKGRYHAALGAYHDRRRRACHGSSTRQATRHYRDARARRESDRRRLLVVAR